jgi:hypothetical protein
MKSLLKVILENNMCVKVFFFRKQEMCKSTIVIGSHRWILLSVLKVVNIVSTTNQQKENFKEPSAPLFACLLAA